MKVSQIWRYPVKSTAGERVEHVRLDGLGVPGDRTVHVEDTDGRWITSRTHPGLLGLHSIINASNEVLLDGFPWSSPEARARIEKIVGRGARLVRDDTGNRFDVLPLLVTTDGAVAAFGRDVRRLRPNLVIGEVVGLEERRWPGRELKIGDAIIRVQDLRQRCVMTTYDPDTQDQDIGVLRDIVRRFDGKIALNCDVLNAGEIREGDAVLLR